MNAIMAGQEIDINYKQLIDKTPTPVFAADETGSIIYQNEAGWSLNIKRREKIWKIFLGNNSINTIGDFNDKLKLDSKIILEIPPSGNQLLCFEVDVIAISSSNHNHKYMYTLSNRQNFNVQIFNKEIHKTFDTSPSSVFTHNEFQNRMVEEIEDYAILMLDEKGTIVNWNKGAQNIKGYLATEIVGLNFEVFYSQEDRDAALPQSLLDKAKAQSNATSEGWRIRKDGSRFWAYVVITAVHDNNGNVIGFTKVTRDLTERKIAEEQREQQTRDIEAKNRQLEEFAYITSHDLQEPIRKIQMFTQLIKNNITDRNHTENYLDKIAVASSRMGTLVKDILEYARLLQRSEDFQKTDLNDILDGVREDLELLIAERHVDLRALTPLPTLSAIRVHMQQLFTNLINNAIKFSDGNPIIEISSHYITIEDDNGNLLRGNYNCLEFKDYGIGFEQKYADEIFKPFKRLSNQAKGTGIGLAVCHKIVENHGGSIEVASKPGAGTSFIVYLPQ